MQEPLKPATPLKARPKAFSKEDGEDLMMSGEGIMNMHPDNVEDAWSAWAESREVSIGRLYAPTRPGLYIGQ